MVRVFEEQILVLLLLLLFVSLFVPPFLEFLIWWPRHRERQIYYMYYSDSCLSLF